MFKLDACSSNSKLRHLVGAFGTFSRPRTKYFFFENGDGFKAQTMGAVCAQRISTFLKSCSAASPGPPLFM